jgi:RNase P/RNase MRP subunit p30
VRSFPGELADLRLGSVALVVVEGLDLDVLDARALEAAHVDAVAVGVGARHVEGLDAAVAAEQVARGARVERVLAEALGAAQQPKAGARHDQVQIARHAADRAVAVAGA